jgi:hypothetical protein
MGYVEVWFFVSDIWGPSLGPMVIVNFLLKLIIITKKVIFCDGRDVRMYHYPRFQCENWLSLCLVAYYFRNAVFINQI